MVDLSATVRAIRQRVKGAGEELAGETKDAVGGLIGDDHLEAEGKVEARKGKARQNINT